jgi:hypothetical protein
MNRNTYNWISALVKSCPGKTTSRAKSEIGCLVFDRYQVGKVQNNTLLFTTEHKISLRRQIIQELDLDPFVDQLPETRLEVAKHHHNEKLAKNPVSHDFILVNCPNKTLSLNHQLIHLQSETIPNAGLMCLSSDISQIDHETIVVVENLAIMQLCSRFELPAVCQNALWLYRGDHKTGAKINACHDLLNRFGTVKKVVVFSDMDPKGLEIALTIPHADDWLGPETSTWSDCFKSKHASRSGYDKQSVAMNFLLSECERGTLSEHFSKLVLHMKIAQSSYRQEHGYAHQIPLSLISIKQKNSKKR